MSGRLSVVVAAAGLPAGPDEPLTLEGAAANVWAPVVRREHFGECIGQVEQVAVVDSSEVELVSQILQRLGPVLASQRLPRRYLDAALHDLHGGPARGRGPGLLPCPMPARGRTPLRDRTSPARGDRSAAPSAVGGGGPSRRRGDLADGCVGLLRLPRLPLSLLASSALGLFASPSVVRRPFATHAAERPDGPPVSRHHELRHPTVQEVCRLVILRLSSSDRRASDAAGGGASERPRVV